MLVHLRIRDFGLIEFAELEPCPGLNVMTGETGAGKSMILGAAQLLKGGRGTAEMIRTGSDEAVIEGLFDLTRAPATAASLKGAGLPLEDELLIRRQVRRTGKGRVYINGSLCTLATLETLTKHLIEICGQREHQALISRSVQRRLLDALIDDRGEQRAQLVRVFQSIKATDRELHGGGLSYQQLAEKADYLRFQLDELEQAELSEGEDLELEARRLRLQRTEELFEAARGGEEELYSAENSVVDRLVRVQQRLERLCGVDDRLGPPAKALDEARVLIEEAVQDLRGYNGALELDPAQLEAVDRRLDLIHRLTRKYGGGVAEILARKAVMEGELEALESHDQRLAEARRRLEQLREQAERLAGELTTARASAGRVLSRSVSALLETLCMKGARFTVDLARLPARECESPAFRFGEGRLAAHGWDRVEFRVMTNPGQDPKPLALVASGGELSRIMLALRQVLGSNDPTSTSLYDEIDSGVSGAVADVVGRLLADVALRRQVLCVTHLPQVAAHADRHFFVGKRSRATDARTTVRMLEPRERVEELARLLGGQKISSQARANAKNLLDAARASAGN
jgi:DNA repair protein RecN (Recombination protein N)